MHSLSPGGGISVGPHDTLDLPGPETAPRKVIIDTDPGVDDALALLFAMRSPELKIEAITAVAGKIPLGLTGVNALGVGGNSRPPGIPPAAGARAPPTRGGGIRRGTPSNSTTGSNPFP